MLPENFNQGYGSLKPLPTGLKPDLPDRLEIDAVLFDVYGTLFISGSGDISLARSRSKPSADLSALLREYAIDRPTGLIRSDFFRAIERSHAESIKKGNDYPEVEIDKIWQEVLGFEKIQQARDFAAAYEMAVNPVSPMPHLSELLAVCRDAQFTMGIISNAQFFTPLLFDWFMDSDLGQLGFSRDLLIFSWEWGVAKPSHLLFQEAARRLLRLGITPEKVLYLGNDMLNDMLPAHTAGFRTALFAGDRRSLRLRREDPRCAGLKPDLCVTDLIQLVKLLQIR